MWYAWETGEVHTELWLGHLRERDHLQVLGVDGRILLKLIFKKCDEEAWTRLISLSIETGCGLLRML